MSWACSIPAVGTETSSTPLMSSMGLVGTSAGELGTVSNRVSAASTYLRGTTYTGLTACCSNPWLVEPNSSPVKPPRPREPTTTTSWVWLALVSASTAEPGTTDLFSLRLGYFSRIGETRTSRSSLKASITPWSPSTPCIFGTAEITSSSASQVAAKSAAISNALMPHFDSSEPTATLVIVLFRCIGLPSSSVYGTTTIGQYAYAGRLELVVPSSRSARPPLPRLPMTIRL